MHIASLIADSQYPWFFWAAPLLFLAALGTVLALSGGYIKRVLFPKYRGRRVEE
jgi:hypothetical protein